MKGYGREPKWRDWPKWARKRVNMGRPESARTLRKQTLRFRVLLLATLTVELPVMLWLSLGGIRPL